MSTRFYVNFHSNIFTIGFIEKNPTDVGNGTERREQSDKLKAAIIQFLRGFMVFGVTSPRLRHDV